MALGSKAFRCRGPREVRLDRDRTCALLDFPPADVDEGRDELAAVLGVPHAVAYAIDDERRDLADAPEAVRAASQAFVGKLDHYDFDLGGALLDGRPLRAVDGGDVAFTFGDGGDNSERARGALREIIASRDVNGLTALTVCRQLMLVIGQLARRRAALDRA